MAAASTSPAPGPTPPVPPSCKASPHKRAKACKRLFALDADVLEDEILRLSPDLLDLLLQDHAEGTDTAPRNIFWATGDYQARGEGYQWHDPIRPDLITGANGHVIMPRFLKRPDCQTARVHGMAEVFTPAWICNTQNNLLDEAWFGRKNVFNVPVTHPDGSPGWEPTEEKIAFPPGKTWQQYIRDTRLEITCGEAPYVASRYEEQTEKLRDCLEKSGFHSPDVNYDVSKGAAVVRFKESKSDELYLLARQAVAESKCSFLVYMEWSG